VVEDLTLHNPSSLLGRGHHGQCVPFRRGTARALRDDDRNRNHWTAQNRSAISCIRRISPCKQRQFGEPFRLRLDEYEYPYEGHATVNCFLSHPRPVQLCALDACSERAADPG
jgi:hypothetical protein